MKISVADAEHPGRFLPHSEKPTVLAAFANTPVYGGGMKIAPQAQIADGQLDLCVIRDLNKFKLFCLFPTVYFGKHVGMEEVQYSRTAGLRIETARPLDVYADGEYVCQTPIEVRSVTQALRVILP
jgi:diacylglycerol kinase family enzyme